jgi:predicted RNA-binding protein with TRAM domain
MGYDVMMIVCDRRSKADGRQGQGKFDGFVVFLAAARSGAWAHGW